MSARIGTKTSEAALPVGVIARLYDRIGPWQDRQGWYEDRPVAAMVEKADLAHATGVFELGCGTGRLAARLLDEILPGDCRYMGVDVSPRMVTLSANRLAQRVSRAGVLQVDGRLPLPIESGSFDRFVSTYVVDLLDRDYARQMMAEAARILTDDGLLAVVSLGPGDGIGTRLVARSWTAVWRRWPRLVGGCRPVDLRTLLGTEWAAAGITNVTAGGLHSQILVARRRPRSDQSLPTTQRP